MNRQRKAHITAVREQYGPIGNDVIDQYLSGRMSRRDLIRRGTLVGLSLPSIAALVAACGGSKQANDGTVPNGGTTPTPDSTTATSAKPAKRGGTMRIGSITPSTASAQLDPIKVNDLGGLVLLSQVGEFLVRIDPDLTVLPSLATKWEPNADASVWTFTLNPAATFNDGTPLTAADVVATFERHLDPGNSANASSAFTTGRLSPGGVKAVDDHIVEFTLDGPMGSFPYIVGSDNYNAIILPASATDTSTFATSKIPTSGAYMIESYDPTKGLTLVANPKYWGTTPPSLDKIEWRFIDDLAAQITAFQAGDLDALANFTVQGGDALLNNPEVVVLNTPSANHRQIHMRTSKGPFADKRVRQAMAIALNRADIVQSLFSGQGTPADDTPLFPIYPAAGTPKVVDQDLATAKSLMAAAAPDGIKATLYGYSAQEMPDLAVLIKSAAAEIGVDLTIEMRDDYYDLYWVAWDANTPGSDIGITDYGHRGVPDVYLTAPLKSVDAGGVWNAAEFSNPDYDKAVDAYSAAADIATKNTAADTIRGILQEEVPVLIPYTFNWLVATKPNVAGLVPSPIGHLFTDVATFT